MCTMLMPVDSVNGATHRTIGMLLDCGFDRLRSRCSVLPFGIESKSEGWALKEESRLVRPTICLGSTARLSQQLQRRWLHPPRARIPPGRLGALGPLGSFGLGLLLHADPQASAMGRRWGGCGERTVESPTPAQALVHSPAPCASILGGGRAWCGPGLEPGRSWKWSHRQPSRLGPTAPAFRRLLLRG